MEGTVQHRTAALKWQPVPPSLPKGAEVTILEGDPQQPRLFTMRLRAPAGTRLASHTHPQAERAGPVPIAQSATRRTFRQ
ncbi:MAG: hypothetical protein ACT4QA_16670 [Panacagrimonas sp.]